MKVIDLTHVISEEMPVYPGTEKPKLQQANTYEKDGFKETLLTMYSHTGTHMDPPNHLFADRTTLDAFPVSQFVGRALVIDCRDLKEGETIRSTGSRNTAARLLKLIISCSTSAGTQGGEQKIITKIIHASTMMW